VLAFHRDAARQIRLKAGDIPSRCCALFRCFQSLRTNWLYGTESAAFSSSFRRGRSRFCSVVIISDRQSWLLAYRAIVVAGLLYPPIYLNELFTGPQLYAHLYGYQPYCWIGAIRYLGFHLIELLEDGN
jgi:hypothetical protein